jgi:DNA-binding transcriptional LysR family regulator
VIHLRQIEVFYAIMRTGSVTDAARVLNVTQPAVSAALKQFESRLRMKLFERRGGKLQPTSEAKALLPEVKEIFDRLLAVERFSQDLAGGMRGVLSIAATPPLCDGFVAKAVAGFMQSRPGLKIHLMALPSPAVLDRVINREVDLGVVYEPVLNSAISMNFIGTTVIGCLLPRRHRLAQRETLKISDLVNQQIISYLPQALLRPFVNRAMGDQPALSFAIEISTSSTAEALVRHGAGIGIIESSLFASRPTPGLVMIPLEPRIELRSLLLRPLNAPESQIVKEFIKELHKSFT